MVTIQCDDFDIRKIMASGQCFRMSENTLSYRENADRYIELIAFGKPLRVKQDGNVLSFSCSEEEFNQIWRQYFDLDTDYSKIIREAQEKYADDPYLMSAIDFSRGIRILKQDFFETLISFIISQRKSIFQIRKSVGTLSYRNGCQMAANGFDGERYSLSRFPHANEIIKMAESGTLRSCTLGYRERYVYEASKWYQDFPGNLESDLASMGYENAMRELMKIKGVGKKVANCVCLYGLHYMNACPVDVWIQRIFDTYYNGEIPLWVYDPNAGLLQQFVFMYERRTVELPFVEYVGTQWGQNNNEEWFI